MSSIAAGTTLTTALVSTGDTTGELVLKTNGSTTAVTIDTAQNVTLESTGAVTIPNGTEAERPTPAAGMLRFNTDADEFEGYNGSSWGSIGGGAIDGIFYENDQLVAANYTIPGTKNAMTTGPITVDSGVTVTISTGARWVVI